MPGSFNVSPAKVIWNYLVAQGLITNPSAGSAWPGYCNFSPPTPDNTVAVYDTESKGSGRFMVGGEVQEHNGVQIAARAADQDDAYLKCKNILIDFDQTVNRTDVTVDSDTYRIQSISRTSDVISAGREPGTGRKLFTANVSVSLRKL